MQEPLATLVVNKLRGNLKVIAIKAPGFGERKTSYLEDIAIMTGATLVKDELGVTLEKATEEVFGMAAKITVGKEACTIVAGDAHQDAINARVAQIKNLLGQTEQDYEKEKLNERVARLSGGVAVIQVCPSCSPVLALLLWYLHAARRLPFASGRKRVNPVQVGAQTETELKEKKLRVEDALNATKAAVEEGIVIGGGCTLLKLAGLVDSIKDEVRRRLLCASVVYLLEWLLAFHPIVVWGAGRQCSSVVHLPEMVGCVQVCENDEQRMGADIVRKALPYALKLIAHNAGINGSVVMDKVLGSSTSANFGYNAATDEYEDLMAAGIIDPTKVIRCCLENATSVARTFLMADCVVTEIPELEDPAAAGAPGGMEMGGY